MTLFVLMEWMACTFRPPQDWNTRKIFERGFKGIMHDTYAISVAPPKLYANRFFDFMQNNVSQLLAPETFKSKLYNAGKCMCFFHTQSLSRSLSQQSLPR